MGDHRKDYRASSRRYGQSLSRSPSRRDTEYMGSKKADNGRTLTDAPGGKWTHDKYNEVEPAQRKKSRWDVGDPKQVTAGSLAERPSSSSTNYTQPPPYEPSRGRDRTPKAFADTEPKSEHGRKRDRSSSVSSGYSSSSSSTSYQSRHKRNRRRRSYSRNRSKSPRRSRSRSRERSRSRSRERSRSSRKHGGSSRREKEKKEKRRHRDKGKEKRKDRKRRSRSPKAERRSVLTGKKIKMKVHKTVEDHERDEKREHLLQFLNSAYE